MSSDSPSGPEPEDHAARVRDLGLVNDQLRRANDALAAIIERSPAGIVSFDTEFRVLSWNPACERVFGFRAAEVIGHLPPFVPESGMDEAMRIFRRSLAGETQRDIVFRRRRRDGLEIDIGVSAAPLYDLDGEIKGVTYVVEDVTERQRLQAQLVQAQKMEAVGQLTGGIAHDINNIFGIIVGNLDLLSDHLAANAEALALNEAALTGALKGAELVRRLLAFSRKQALAITTVELGPTLAQLVPLMRRTLGERVVVTHRGEEGAWPARADAVQLESCVLNLAINARDAMPQGGRLTVTWRNATVDAELAPELPALAPGDYVVLSVSDTGSGMAPDVVDRVFEPFFTTKEVGKGSGLGLSMVYGYMQQSGGTVKIYSEVGHGTTVQLYLPRASSRPARAEVAPEPAAAIAPAGRRILVVEDNPELRAIVVSTLMQQGYAVVEAPGAVAALADLESGARYDLLFTDVIMPGRMTGIELAETARQRRLIDRALFTSGFASPEILDSRVVDRGERLLQKPYRRADLVAAVAAALA